MTISTIGAIGFFVVGIAAHFLSGLLDGKMEETLERIVLWCISGSIFCVVLRVVGY